MLSRYSALISAVQSFTCNRPTCLACYDSVAYRANLGCLVAARFSDCSKQYAGLESWATKLARIETAAIRLRKHANHFSTKLGTCVTNAGDWYAEEAVILRNSPDRTGTVGVLRVYCGTVMPRSIAHRKDFTKKNLPKTVSGVFRTSERRCARLLKIKMSHFTDVCPLNLTLEY